MAYGDVRGVVVLRCTHRNLNWAVPVGLSLTELAYTLIWTSLDNSPKKRSYTPLIIERSTMRSTYYLLYAQVLSATKKKTDVIASKHHVEGSRTTAQPLCASPSAPLKPH
jgi:hypothetical protein